VRNPIAIAATNEGRYPRPDVVKKPSISSELALKMVNAAVAKAKELGVAENVAILDSFRRRLTSNGSYS
jgi:hypothetical protein